MDCAHPMNGPQTISNKNKSAQRSGGGDRKQATGEPKRVDGGWGMGDGDHGM